MTTPRRTARAATRRRLEARQREREELFRQVRHDPTSLPKPFVYNDLPAYSIDDTSTPTMETQVQADKLFEEQIREASSFKSSKIDDKREWFRRLLHTAKRSMWAAGTIQYPRNKNHSGFSKCHLQVVECAIETGLFHPVTSPKGSPKMSRLLPMPILNEYTNVDPWQFDPNTQRQLVFLVKRDDKTDLLSYEELMALRPLHIARETQQRLEVINEVNALYEITYLKWDEYENDLTSRRQIRPVHFAKFTERWDWHGRLYTGKYGHQSLRKIERRSIEFNGCPSAELDYSGMHPRLLYHLKRIDFRGDPYAFWGEETTKPQRLLAKTVINAALNARSRSAAIAACNFATSTWTQERDANGKPVQMKQGDTLRQARQLLKARKESALTFAQIYDLAMERHPQIAQHFGTDMGIRLMRIDSAIAIDIMYEFAKQAIPCLCCHDSFIVPEHHGEQLRDYMNRFYYLRLRNLPVIK